MVKHRLFFGTLMTIFFVALMIFDGWLDGSLTRTPLDDKSVQGTIFCLFIIFLAIPAQLELSKLAAVRNLRTFLPVSITASVIIATYWYWRQFINIDTELTLVFIFTFVLLALFLYQYFSCKTTSVIANCGTSCFSILYLGLLSSFCLAIRINLGLWQLLMFIFVIKSADIGAYAIGSAYGKHRFSPRLSPKKSWEGMAGAAGAAVLVAICFAAFFDIISWLPAIVFGVVFAFIGQFGDLAESMMKRDAQQKDSANKVPGFGGILDIIDSPLAAAPFAYLFFIWNS